MNLRVFAQLKSLRAICGILAVIWEGIVTAAVDGVANALWINCCRCRLAATVWNLSLKWLIDC